MITYPDAEEVDVDGSGDAEDASVEGREVSSRAMTLQVVFRSDLVGLRVDLIRATVSTHFSWTTYSWIWL